VVRRGGEVYGECRAIATFFESLLAEIAARLKDLAQLCNRAASLKNPDEDQSAPIACRMGIVIVNVVPFPGVLATSMRP